MFMDTLPNFLGIFHTSRGTPQGYEEMPVKYKEMLLLEEVTAQTLQLSILESVKKDIKQGNLKNNLKSFREGFLKGL